MEMKSGKVNSWGEYLTLDKWLMDSRGGNILLYRMAFMIGGSCIVFFNWLDRFVLHDSTDGFPIDILLNLAMCVIYLGLSYIPRYKAQKKHWIYDFFIYVYASHCILIFAREGFTDYYLGLTLVSIQGLTFLIRNRFQIVSYFVTVNGVLGFSIFYLGGDSMEVLLFYPILFFISSFIISLVQWTRISDMDSILKAGEDVQKNKRNIAAVLESTNDLIWSVDRTYKLIFVNSAFVEAIGKITGTLLQVGDSLKKVINATDNKMAHFNHFESAFEGNTEVFESEFTFSREKKVIYRIALHPIYEKNQVVGISAFAQDITELHQMQKDLLRSQERYANAALAANDGLWEWDLTTQEVYLSPRWKEMIGYADHELPNSMEAWISVVHPDDRMRVTKLLQEHIKGKSISIFGEYRLIHKNGSTVWILGKGMAMRDEKGWALRLSGSHSDVTQRRESEEELKRLSLVASKTLNGVIISDAEGKIEWANKGFENITGYTFEEVVGRKPGDFLQGLLTNYKTRLQMSRAIANQLPVSVEVVNYHKSGHHYWVRLSITPVFDDAGILEKFIAIQEDITERKRTEEELKKLSLVASKTMSGVVISDEYGKIEWVNDGFEKITGYTLEEVVSTRPGNFLHGPLTGEVAKENMRISIQKKVPIVEEIVNYHKNGTPYWVRVAITPVFNEWGNLEKYIAIQDDITVKKRAEVELLRAKEAAEAASQAKADFLANMSHEIRTPMNAVIGMTGLLLTTSLNDEQKDFVETIRNSGDNLLTIINDILDFSKIDAGKLELEEYSFSLVDCIEDVVDLFAGKAMEKQIELMADIDMSIPPYMLSDATRITQVISNLISNAIKFTPEKGEVLVRAKYFPGSNGEKSNICFSVSDTGIGIPPEKVNKLFQSFSQVDASNTRKYGGTGLGLAISRKLIELLGGEIKVLSRTGEGAHFYFNLPFTEGEPNQKDLPEEKEHWPGKKVLVVDDNDTNRTIFEHQCKSWGLIPILVSDPLKAVEVMEQHPDCQIGILDMQMPHLTGIDLAEMLHQNFSDRNLSLILISSVGVALKETDRAHFKAVGMKPMRRGQLLRLIHAMTPSDGAEEELLINKESLSVESPASLEGVCLLLTEDNMVNQKVALRMLDKLGIRAEIASNGKEACDAVQLRSFDIILMDVQMPEMDGFEATRAIREMTHLKQQPVIVAMTANALKGDRERCLEAGMDDYISKPVKIDELREMVVKWTAVAKLT